MNGDERLGDSLYTCSVVALDVKTAKRAGTTSSLRTTSGTGDVQ
jgi:hypothetical protein